MLRKRSKVGAVLLAVYILWAAVWVVLITHDGLRCSVPGGSIVSICGDVIGFVLAGIPAISLAVLIGIRPDYESLLQLGIYIGFSMILVYLLGTFLEAIAHFLWQQFQSNRHQR